MLQTYTLADLTRITGAKRRTVQLWAEANVIRAFSATDRAGTGVHRLFSRTEAIIACLVEPLAAVRISIGNLKAFASDIRNELAHPRVYVASALETMEARIEAGIKAERPIYLIVGIQKDGFSFEFLDPYIEHERMKLSHKDDASGRHVTSQYTGDFPPDFDDNRHFTNWVLGNSTRKTFRKNTRMVVVISLRTQLQGFR